MKEKFIMAVLVIISASFLGTTAFLYMSADHVAPVIHVPQTNIEYHEGDDERILLEGVTATDDRNGDVTKRLCVDSIISNDEKGTATVVYAAYDWSKNVSKAKRVVRYVKNPVEEPVVETATDLNGEVQ